MSKSLLTIFLLLLLISPARATHLMGGELTYRFDTLQPGGSFYFITLIVYRYCDTTGVVPAPLDPSMKLGIFQKDSLNPTDTVFRFSSDVLYLTSSSFVEYPQGNANCLFQPTACIERGIYEERIFLPTRTMAFHLFVERCCRNGNIINLMNPGAAGMSFYTVIPPFINNSSPQISDVSVPYICIGDSVTIINNAYDPDGDSLVYSFVIPYNGVSSTLGSAPDPVDYSPYPLPIINVDFAPGYSLVNIFGTGGFSSIDPVTGLTKFYVPNQGFYVAAVEIKEFRNGIFLSSIRRDIQFIAIACPPNPVPVIQPVVNGGVFSVMENQQICFNVTASDVGGDSLFLVGSGPLLDINFTNPSGIFPDAAGAGTVTSQFCWTPVCGMSRPAPYQFSVVVKDNGCPQKAIGQVFSIYVNPGLGSLTPTVSISQQPAGMLCQGSNVTFHATANYPGNNPVYTWFVNGNVVTGVNDSIFSTNLMNDGDEINVSIISDANCLLVDSASSLPFVVTVDPQPAPQISISSVPADFLCPQQNALFNSSVLYGGASPAYQWYSNGIPSGTNQSTFTASTPSGLVLVYLTLTPSTGCPPENSNIISLTVQPMLTPLIQLTANNNDTICPGESVLFVANASSTGTSPVYYWTVNGAAISGNSASLTLSNLNDGDSVNVSVSSSYACLSNQFTFANPIGINLFDPLSADLTDGPLVICSGSPVELEMIASGGKNNAYMYSWNFGNATSSNQTIIFPTVTDFYYSTVNDNCYTPVSDSIFIEVNPTPISDFSWLPDKPSIFFPSVDFMNLSAGATSWHWDFGDLNFSTAFQPSHEYSAPGIFPVTLYVKNDFECTDTLTQLLEVQNFITLYIPNSFTPNNDGKNDEFSAIGNSYEGYKMSIFNRWGQEIFKSMNPFESWKGTTNDGNAAPMGSYIYIIIPNNSKNQKIFSGVINLIR